MDDNLAHCSYEASILGDPDITPPEQMWKLMIDPMKAQPQRLHTRVPERLSNKTDDGERR